MLSFGFFLQNLDYLTVTSDSLLGSKIRPPFFGKFLLTTVGLFATYTSVSFRLFPHATTKAGAFIHGIRQSFGKTAS